MEFYSTKDNNCSGIIHLFIHIADNFSRQFNLAVWKMTKAPPNYILPIFCHVVMFILYVGSAGCKNNMAK